LKDRHLKNKIISLKGENFSQSLYIWHIYCL